jgi:hypothetical protein
MEFNITEEFAALMSMKGTTADAADLYEEARKALQSLDIRMQKLFGSVTDGAANCG